MLFNTAAISVILALTAHVNAHAFFFVGQKGDVSRNDAGQGGPCGKGGPAKADEVIKTGKFATTTATGANGAFTFQGLAFNGGKDGSTFVTMEISVSGSGNDFKPLGKVTKNGDNPGKDGVLVNLAAELGAGTKCNNNKCLVQLTGAGGFRSCIAVQQAGGGGGGAAAAPPAAAPAAAPPAAAATQGGGGQQNQNQNKNQGQGQGQGQGGQKQGQQKKKTMMGRIRKGAKKFVKQVKQFLMPAQNGKPAQVVEVVELVPVQNGNGNNGNGNGNGNAGAAKQNKRGMLLPGGRRAFIEKEGDA